MNSQFPFDIAKIGYHQSNGVEYRFKGMIDEIRIWNRALSEEEIRQKMCKKISDSEAGLIGHWTFDEISGNVLTDKSQNHFDGELKGNPSRVYSGAPIGDESIFLYAPNWSAVEVTMMDNLDQVKVLNVQGDPEGIHIYEVKDLPSQYNGLNLSTVTQPYFGIFVASNDTNNLFDVNYNFDQIGVCKLFTRVDNSIANWEQENPTLNKVIQRTELIKELGDKVFTINLGADEESCSIQSKILNPLDDPIGCDFTWQNGSKLPTFQVLDFGVYWVKIRNGCSEGSDTIRISKIILDSLRIPNIFTPNEDHLNQFFEIDSRILGASLNIYNRWGETVYQSTNYHNDWDGSGLPSGVYFYRLVNECIEEKKGSITISR